MKNLFVLRHAQTFPSQGGSDRERQLTPQGLADAQKLGRAMKDRGYVPDFIFCSPAMRTRQTLAAVLESLGPVETSYEKIIYEGGYSELMKLAQGADDSYNAVLVVGHNPAIHQFAASIAHEDGSPLLNQMAQGYAPGTLSVFDVSCNKWADLKAGENRLMDLRSGPINFAF